MEWYYVDNGQQSGPVDEAGLAELVRQGRVGAQTLVWNATLSNWQAYSEVTAQLAAGGVATELPEAAPMAAQASAYCAECGRPFPVGEMVQYSGSYVCGDCKGVFFQKIREGVSAPGQFAAAGFWIRFGAKIIDGLLMAAVGIPLGMVLGNGAPVSGVNPGMRLLFAFPTFSLFLLVQTALVMGYCVFMNGRFGQTLGKMACGIRIIRPDGQQISYARAFGRYCAENIAGFLPLLNLIVLLVSLIMLLTDDQKRALHDRICDTRVVYKQ